MLILEGGDILCLKRLSLSVESLSPSHKRETILSLLSLLERPCLFSPLVVVATKCWTVCGLLANL
jgi:hypothetical protein